MRAHAHKYVCTRLFCEYCKSDSVTKPRSPVPSKKNTGTLRDLYGILGTSITKAEFHQEVNP